MGQETILQWAEKIKAGREQKKKKAYASAVKTQTEMDPRVVETKELDIQRKHKEAKEKAKPESGTEAVDRILDELKKAQDRVFTKDGQPHYPSEFPPRGTAHTKSPYYYTGLPGTASQVGTERIGELREQLAVAKSAKEKNMSFEDEKHRAEVQNKFKEYIDLFTVSGVDPKKARYLAELQTKEWYNKTYGK